VGGSLRPEDAADELDLLDLERGHERLRELGAEALGLEEALEEVALGVAERLAAAAERDVRLERLRLDLEGKLARVLTTRVRSFWSPATSPLSPSQTTLGRSTLGNAPAPSI
jgi:hypothetical protein